LRNPASVIFIISRCTTQPCFEQRGFQSGSRRQVVHQYRGVHEWVVAVCGFPVHQPQPHAVEQDVAWIGIVVAGGGNGAVDCPGLQPAQFAREFRRTTGIRRQWSNTARNPLPTASCRCSGTSDCHEALMTALRWQNGRSALRPTVPATPCPFHPAAGQW
jgi:hypothetical protein